MEDKILFGKYQTQGTKIRVLLYEDLDYVTWLLGSTQFELTREAQEKYEHVKGVTINAWPKGLRYENEN